METLKILFLAVIQGLTEFLPVSSSGNLVIAQRLCGIDKPGVAIEVLLHFGTLLAVVWFYRKRLILLAIGMTKGVKESWMSFLSLVVASVPAAAAFLLFKDFFERSFDGNLAFVGRMLLVTGLLLVSLKFVGKGKVGRVGIWRALAIGVAQAIAVLPGVSRSGATISTARHLGVDAREAADFSFLMSLPVLLGAVVMSVIGGDVAEISDVGVATIAAAVAVSAVTGYMALRLIIKTLAGKRFWLFGVYCIAMGLLAMALK